MFQLAFRLGVSRRRFKFNFMKYRKNPIVIEAIQWNGKNNNEIANFMNVGHCKVINRKIRIQTLEGAMWASETDFIIKGVANEFYPCRSDIFTQTYEKAEE